MALFTDNFFDVIVSTETKNGLTFTRTRDDVRYAFDDTWLRLASRTGVETRFKRDEITFFEATPRPVPEAPAES